MNEHSKSFVVINLVLRSGTRVLHDFWTSTPFKEKSSDNYNDLRKLKLLTNFDVNLTSFLEE